MREHLVRAAAMRDRAKDVMNVCSSVMLCIMRTTISLEDQLASQVRREAAARGMSVSAFIAATLSDALKRREPAEQRPFELLTASGVRPLPTVNLDRPRAIETDDDAALYARGQS